MKYISKLRKNLYYWTVNGKRPKDWREMDTAKEAKMYKKTSVKYSFKWDKVDDHRRIKASREEGKDVINKELEENINGDL